MKVSKNTHIHSYIQILLGLLVVATFVMSVFAIIIATAAFTLQQTQAKNDSDEIYKLSTDSALLKYCVDNSVRPCTEQSMNDHAAAQ